MQLVHPLYQPTANIPNPCAVNNGGCSHLCVLKPKDGGASIQASCLCPEHFKVSSNGKSCAPACDNQEIECGWPDPKCISKYWKCDGEKDCKGGDDEPSDCRELFSAARNC